MSIGTGIFLGLLVVGLVVLFLGTKDRWRWRRIAVRTLLLVVGIPVLLAGAWIIYLSSNSGVAALDTYAEFWGIPLGTPEAELLFMKGAPASKSEDGAFWTYESSETWDAWRYMVSIGDEGNVAWVLYTGGRGSAPQPVEGVGYGTSYAQMVAVFGEPSSRDDSNDDLLRMYYYVEKQLVFGLEKRAVVAFGVFDPARDRPSFR